MLSYLITMQPMDCIKIEALTFFEIETFNLIKFVQTT